MVKQKEQLAKRLKERGITLHYLCNELPTVFVEVNPREWTYEKFRYLLLTLGFDAKYNTLKAGQLSTGTKSVEGYWCDLC